MKKAVFLDRDGTLNIDHGYVHKIDDFQFIEGSIDALKELKDMGYLLVLVTNQALLVDIFQKISFYNLQNGWIGR